MTFCNTVSKYKFRQFKNYSIFIIQIGIESKKYFETKKSEKFKTHFSTQNYDTH